MTKFSLIAYSINGSVAGKHKVESSIKKEIEIFKTKLSKEHNDLAGISLRDDDKDEILNFGINKDADGDSYVEIWS